jgi:Tfp pilus assembly PilM family ATPase
MFLDKLKKLIPSFSSESPYFLTIDLNSDTLKIYFNEIVIVENEEKIRVRKEYKEHVSDDIFNYGEILDFNKIKQIFEKILMEIKKDFKEINVKDCIVILSGSSSRSVMTTLQVNRTSNSEIDENENTEILQKLFEASYNEISSIVYDETGIESPGLELIDFIPVYISLDGREVIDLIGESGDEVQVCYSVFFGKTEVLDIIRKLVGTLGLNLKTFIPSNLALLKTLKKSRKDKIDCVILDIGGRTTEAMVCFGGGILLNKTLDIGGSDLTLVLAEKLNLSYLNAEKVKRLYTFNKLKENESGAVQKVLTFNLDTWLLGLEQLFLSFDEVKVFPSDFYVVGGSSELPDVLEYLFEEPWTKSIPFKSLPKFKKIDFSNLKKLDKVQVQRPSEDLIPIVSSIYYLEKRSSL